jgi:predicted transcriptional regulator
MSRARPPKDPRGGHARLYWSILDSPAWRTLTHADVRVYLALRRKLGRTNNGDINATLAEMKHAGIFSSSTLSAALHRLEALGFIEKTRQGGIAAGGKLCSLYRFTDESTFDIAKAGVRAGPATDEWKRFANLAEARAAVRGFARKNKVKVRPSNRSGATIESESAACASTIEHVPASPIRLSKRGREGQNGVQAA